MRVASWNINSVRLRIDIVERYIEEAQPDVLCLQEIKCIEDAFPAKAFEKLGYTYVGIHGQKGYHGVATVSRLPAETVERRDFCSVGDARHLSTDISVGGRTIRLHNFYIPAGGDEPNAEKNPKFAHKLSFLDELGEWTKAQEHRGAHEDAILLGDFNIAPHEDDVWSHKQLLKVVSHTPIETEKLISVKEDAGLVDLARTPSLQPEDLFTWWSYRARDWAASNRGRRLDHIWTTDGLAEHCRGFNILSQARGWDRPSDHVPIMAEFAF